MARRSVPDRARRRAIRAYAAQLGVSYSVAARLLAAQMAAPTPSGVDEHRAWLFAVRERRPFALRVRDTRLAADLPLGRAAHLAERFPPLRQGPGSPLYDGDGRQATLALLYVVLGHESPALLPAAEELTWVAEMGEEAAVDIICSTTDRAARLLLDEDRWHLWTRIEAALVAGEASSDRSVRDAAVTLGREFRTTILRRALHGARHTLDALLVAAHDGHEPGSRVRIAAGPGGGRVGTVVGIHWPRTGPPTGYDVRVDGFATILTVPVDDVGPLDQPAAPEPVLT